MHYASLWSRGRGWRHAYCTVTPGSTLSFGGGDSFTVDGVPIVRNLALIGAGISPDVTFGINYSGQVGEGTVDQGISGQSGLGILGGG